MKMAQTRGPNRWRKTGRVLGQGGQGQILVVEDNNGEYAGSYALKQLLNDKRRSRLENEILTTRSLFALGAPVLRIVDDYLASDKDAPRPWYVTPIMQNGNLREWQTRKFPHGPSEDWVLDFFEKCAVGLRQIHDSGVAHRDIKPENILIDDAEEPVFCDLGLCLPLTEDVGVIITTDDLERIGSLHYTPREGYGGRRPTGEGQFAFDVFACGKILYELLSGKVLPGLESHRSPDYDLAQLKGTVFCERVNTLLDGLLHEDPAARLTLWYQIDKEIDALRGTLHPRKVETMEDKVRERLSRITDLLIKKGNAHIPTPIYVSQEVQSRCVALADRVLQLWAGHREINVILEDWLSGRTDIGTKEQRIENSIFASFLEGPYIQSASGLDPLRSAGWKRGSEIRKEVLFGFRAARSQPLPSMWMGLSVFPSEHTLVILLMMIRKKPGNDGPIDVFGAVKELRGEIYAISLESEVESHATSLAKQWVEVVLGEIEGAVKKEA